MPLLSGLRREKNELVIVILRFAIGSVFLWFGIDKWLHPELWYGWVPGWLWQYLPVSPEVFMYANGAFEFLVGILLVAGRLVWLAAAASGLFLLSIFVFLGSNEVTIRDMGLLGGCLALFVHANAAAKRPLSVPWIANITALYVILLFVSGVMYLKNAG
jgi:uncharacterized membrane protein YphA (DoxX/SURF4 family)